MTPTDPTRLRQLLTSIKGPLAVRPSTRADGSDCDDVIDKGDGNLNVCEGCDEDRAELIATALNALPSLLATAEWARKARGVLQEFAVCAAYHEGASNAERVADDLTVGALRRAASLLAPALSETETTAPAEPDPLADIRPEALAAFTERVRAMGRARRTASLRVVLAELSPEMRGTILSWKPETPMRDQPLIDIGDAGGRWPARIRSLTFEGERVRVELIEALPEDDAPTGDAPPSPERAWSTEPQWLTLDEAATLNWTPSPMPTPEEQARMATARLVAHMRASVGENPWMMLVAPVAERLGAVSVYFGATVDQRTLTATGKQAVMLRGPGGEYWSGVGDTLDEAAADLCRKAPTGDAGGGDDGG